jgi:hypothetical protein
MYPVHINGKPGKRFAAFDYGYAFGGQPKWSETTLATIAKADLPSTDPFTGQPYPNGALLNSMIEQLRTVTVAQIEVVFSALHPPRWGVLESDLTALASTIKLRAQALVTEFDSRYRQQLEVM